MACSKRLDNLIQRKELWRQYSSTPGAQSMTTAWDYQLVTGRETHDPKHGASIFPAAMRWIWRD